jgi:hypothetical protein
MPRRVDPAWGWSGMVRLDGYGKEDDRTVGLCRSSDADLKDRGRQGFHGSVKAAQSPYPSSESERPWWRDS